MTKIEQLIKDLEAATEGTEALDIRVMSALGKPRRHVECWDDEDGHGWGRKWEWDGPLPTQSVDDALALVPELTTATMKKGWERCSALVGHGSAMYAATIALALTIACLKVKEATEDPVAPG